MVGFQRFVTRLTLRCAEVLSCPASKLSFSGGRDAHPTIILSNSTRYQALSQIFLCKQGSFSGNLFSGSAWEQVKIQVYMAKPIPMIKKYHICSRLSSKKTWKSKNLLGKFLFAKTALVASKIQQRYWQILGNCRPQKLKLLLAVVWDSAATGRWCWCCQKRFGTMAFALKKLRQ